MQNERRANAEARPDGRSNRAGRVSNHLSGDGPHRCQPCPTDAGPRGSGGLSRDQARDPVRRARFLEHGPRIRVRWRTCSSGSPPRRASPGGVSRRLPHRRRHWISRRSARRGLPSTRSLAAELEARGPGFRISRVRCPARGLRGAHVALIREDHDLFGVGAHRGVIGALSGRSREDVPTARR